MNLEPVYGSVPLPEDLQRLKLHGDFEELQRHILRLLEREIPAALRRRLERELDVLAIFPREYPHTLGEVSQIMGENLEGYDPAEPDQLRKAGLLDWIFINGQVRVHRRFFENLVRTMPGYARRLRAGSRILPAALRGDAPAREQRLLRDHIQRVRQQGGETVEIRLRTSLKIKKEFERPGEPVRVHLPLPIHCRGVSGFCLLAAHPAPAVLAPPDAPQRTACFTLPLEPGMTFSVEYAFINQGEYHDLDAPPRSSENGEPLTVPGAPDLAEQLPHIQFTPYLRLLLRELLAGETDPLKQVRRIYDFVSTRIGYTYMREYAALETICEYGAVNLKGDCGVQAMVFITLCRMAGIPARWQSGLYVTEGYTGPHDWAEFYLEPWGWLFADPSFGGDAWRREDPLGWNYYFGNIDVFRMPANRAILADFTPPKRHRRSDPVDNQRGEVEYEDRGLPSWGFETVHQLISISGGSSQNTA